MDNQNKDNKKKKNQTVEIKGDKPRRIFKISFFNLIVLIGSAFIVYLIFSSFIQQPLGREIQFDEFITNIKNNKYSQIEVRDDGRLVSYSKFVDVGFIDNTNIESSVNKDATKYNDKLEVLSVEDFIEKVKPPQNINELRDMLLGKGSKIQVKSFIFGENFIIVAKANSTTQDIIIKDISEETFKQKLSDAKLTLESITTEIVRLKSASAEKNVSDIKDGTEQKRYSDIWLVGNRYIARANNDNIEKSVVLTAPLNTDLFSYLKSIGVEFDKGNIEVKTVAMTQLPWGDIFLIGSVVILGGFLFFLFRGLQGSNNSLIKFGQSKAGVFFGRKPEVTFKDVAGIDEAKEELNEVVMFLKKPEKFTKLGARIPKGLLLVGSPGTGKTLLARAIAGEAGVPFFHTSGSEFEEMLVGAGASRVRDLFDKAKRAAPALIFIDEIDAVARKRGTTIQSSNTEQTLNQILVEMDGFKKNENVIVIAATNRPDVLDPAILRPGRFDRRVVIDLPDLIGRQAIIKIHSANKPLAADVDIEKIAKRTVGFSGADIENMLNEAAIITAKANRKEITAHDIEEAATKVAVGPEKKRKREDYELKLTAYHEAGHAIVAKLSPQSDPVHRITIVSRGMSLGSTMQLPQNDKLQQTKTELDSRLRVLLAGRAAEELIFKDITGGASNDIEKATSIARKMVKVLGMSEKLGLVKYGESNELQYLGYGYGEQKDYSEETAQMIDDEVRDILSKAYKDAKKLLSDNIEILHDLSNLLLKQEVVEGEEFEKLFDK